MAHSSPCRCATDYTVARLKSASDELDVKSGVAVDRHFLQPVLSL